MHMYVRSFVRTYTFVSLRKCKLERQNYKCTHESNQGVCACMFKTSEPIQQTYYLLYVSIVDLRAYSLAHSLMPLFELQNLQEDPAAQSEPSLLAAQRPTFYT